MIYRISKVMLIAFCLTSLLVSVAYSQDPNLDRERSSISSSGRTESTVAREIPNFFFKTTSLFVKVLIFAILALLVYGITFIMFKNAIERNKSPINAFFISNVIFLIALLIFAFICFGEYTYKVKQPARTIVEHLRSINWIIWIVVIVLLAIFIIVSSRSRASSH